MNNCGWYCACDNSYLYSGPPNYRALKTNLSQVNDEIVLVDYKTDYVKQEKELINKYKEQLNIYKQALEQALNKKVRKVYIYSMCLNREIKL